jgi:tetratricopeptide (TPR) repeat protein
MTMGRFDEAYRICEEALNKNPDWYSYHRKAAHTDLLRGRNEEVLEKLSLVRTQDSDSSRRFTGYAYLYLGRNQEALAELRKAAERARNDGNQERKLLAHLDLGKMLAFQGDYSNALEELAEALRTSNEIYQPSFNPVLPMTDYIAGWAMVEKGDLDEALVRAESIKRYVEQEGYESLYMDYDKMLTAKIHLARGDGRAAKEELDEISVLSTFYPHYHTLLAETHALIGNVPEALSIYENDIFGNILIYRYVNGGDPFYYFLAGSRVNYRLGQLHVQQGNTSQAIEYFEKALEQWKDADEDLPELLDARRRLARLNENP